MIMTFGNLGQIHYINELNWWIYVVLDLAVVLCSSASFILVLLIRLFVSGVFIRVRLLFCF